MYKDNLTNRTIKTNLKDIKDNVNVNNISSKIIENSREVKNNAKPFKL